MISIQTYLMSEIRKIDLMGLIRRRYLLMGLVILSMILLLLAGSTIYSFLEKSCEDSCCTFCAIGRANCRWDCHSTGRIFSDRTKTKFGNISNNIGQRSPWYVLGLVLVVSCYIPIYQTFISDNKSNEYAYYIIFPAIFNIGWAALQISHMSLVPSLTCSRKRRVY